MVSDVLVFVLVLLFVVPIISTIALLVGILVEFVEALCLIEVAVVFVVPCHPIVVDLVVKVAPVALLVDVVVFPAFVEVVFVVVVVVEVVAVAIVVVVVVEAASMLSDVFMSLVVFLIISMEVVETLKAGIQLFFIELTGAPAIVVLLFEVLFCDSYEVLEYKVVILFVWFVFAFEALLNVVPPAP